MVFLHSCISTLNGYIIYTYLDELFCTSFLYGFSYEIVRIHLAYCTKFVTKHRININTLTVFPFLTDYLLLAFVIFCVLKIIHSPNHSFILLPL